MCLVIIHPSIHPTAPHPSPPPPPPPPTHTHTQSMYGNHGTMHVSKQGYYLSCRLHNTHSFTYPTLPPPPLSTMKRTIAPYVYLRIPRI